MSQRENLVYKGLSEDELQELLLDIPEENLKK
jgi:hypothetical protein